MASTSSFFKLEQDKLPEIIDGFVPENIKRKGNWSASVFNGKLSKNNIFFWQFSLLYTSLYDGSVALSICIAFF